MVILINGSNLNGGGGAQVADSICQSLNTFPQHHFIVVLSSYLQRTSDRICDYVNVKVYSYNYPSRDWKSFISGRNDFLDHLVEAEHIEMVLTVFAPCKWKPRVPHLAGFALSHLVMPESPYFQRMSFKQRVQWRLKIKTWKYIFNRTDYFYTENTLITERLQKLFPTKKVYTVTNYYNQVFDQPENQKFHQLPKFNGWQFLNVGSPFPHKNLNISIEIAQILKSSYWDVIKSTEKPNFRFLFTIKEADFAQVPKSLKEHFYFIDKVDISEVPSLYEQTDILFQPTLLECFTAVYPEAMRMGKPIVTTDLEFAHGLCGEGALYYSATDPKSAAEKIVELITNCDTRKKIIEKGKIELQKFDDYNTRCSKIIALCELIADGK